MRTLDEIRTEIEQLTEQRSELLHKLSQGHDALLAVEHNEVEERNAEEPDLYGLFDEQPYMPAKISIYRRPLVEDFGGDPKRLEEEIRITVLHELAHYFGIDEDRLDELGYA